MFVTRTLQCLSFLSLLLLPPPRSTLFPYTTLFRSRSTRSSSTARSGSRRFPPPAVQFSLSQSNQYPVQDARGSEEPAGVAFSARSEEHTSELQSRENLVCRLLLEKKKIRPHTDFTT